MLISDAKNYVGQIVDISFTNRQGNSVEETVEVFDVTFVPLYGPCLITDIGDIRLDRVNGMCVQEVRRAA